MYKFGGSYIYSPDNFNFLHTKKCSNSLNQNIKEHGLKKKKKDFLQPYKLQETGS